MFQDAPFGRPLLSYIRDGLLDIFKTFKEPREALVHVRRDSLVLATPDLHRTLQAFYEFRSHVNKMVNNMNVLEKHLQRKIQERY